jgi:hypothetical protein
LRAKNLFCKASQQATMFHVAIFPRTCIHQDLWSVSLEKQTKRPCCFSQSLQEMASDDQLWRQCFSDSADFSLHVFNQGFSKQYSAHSSQASLSSHTSGIHKSNWFCNALDSHMSSFSKVLLIHRCHRDEMNGKGERDWLCYTFLTVQ